MPEYSRIKGRKTKQNKTEAGTEESTQINCTNTSGSYSVTNIAIKRNKVHLKNNKRIALYFLSDKNLQMKAHSRKQTKLKITALLLEKSCSEDQWTMLQKKINEHEVSQNANQLFLIWT